MSGTQNSSTPKTGAGADFPHPVTVEIRGLVALARFARLADALTALRASLAILPLEHDHAAYLAELFGPDKLDQIGRQLATVGEVSCLAWLGVDAYPIRLRPARSEVNR